MTLAQSHVRYTLRSRFCARGLRQGGIGNARASGARRSSIGDAGSQGGSACTAIDSDTGRRRGNKNRPAAAAASRSMALRQAVRFTVPGISTSAALRLQCEAALAAVSGENNNAATRAATAAGIVGRADVRGTSVCRESGSAGKAVCTNDDDSATGRAAARLSVAVGVIACAGATTAAHGDTVCRRRKNRTPLAPRAQVGIPGISAETSRSAVAATAAAGILVVGGWVGIGAATASIPGRAARAAAIRAGRAAGIAGGSLRVTSCGFHPERRASDSFSLHSIHAVRHRTGIGGRGSVQVIRVGAANPSV